MNHLPLPAPVILATRSPRRIELARRMGLQFSAIPADLDEIQRPGESPESFVERMAIDKADLLAGRHPDSLVIGCDTIVVVDDEVMGKPAGPDDAKRMLGLLSGREHRVLSGLSVIWVSGSICHSEVETTFVRFRAMTNQEIDGYVAEGEPLDKAGAYAIQGGAAAFVEEIRGSYDNVVGLPTEKLAAVLTELSR